MFGVEMRLGLIFGAALFVMVFVIFGGGIPNCNGR